MKGDFKMITLAIDASTKSTGIAIFKQNQLVYHQCIQANDNKVYTRINKMTKRIKQIYQKYKPTDIVIQDVLPQDVKHNQQIFKALIYLQAAIVLQLDKIKAPKITFVTSSHWRSKCGIKVGRGVKRETLKQASIRLVNQLYKINVNDDVSDAICIGIAYISENRSAF